MHVFLVMCFCIMFVTAIKVYLPQYANAVLNYDSCFIIMEAVCLFILASGFTLRSNVVNKLAESSLWVYLLHRDIEKFVMKTLSAETLYRHNLVLMLLYIVLTCSVVYFICFIIHNCIRWFFIQLVGGGKRQVYTIGT